jgi:3'-phosphoadenosine 5'-phosphosulfate sulfotransferase (PAPS reductase)/FAD synthetase
MARGEMTMNVISASYGNDSRAMIQWAHENGIEDVVVTYIDTGWAGEAWRSVAKRGEAWAKSLGFETVTITPEVQFADLIRHKKGFPNQRFQWCSGLLKGIPFLNWLDARDPNGEAAVFVGKRRAESRERADTPCVTVSEYHGGRLLVHPLYAHSEAERDALLRRAGFEPLPHRSLECDPCVNANRADFRRLSARDIEKTAALEAEVGKTMFRPVKYGGAHGIEQVIAWAKYSRGQYSPEQEDLFSAGCGSPFGCGL